MGYAFISYITKNQASADAMRKLFNKHNIDTWMAPYDIPAGSKYAAVITKAIRDCSCFVLLLSNDSQASEAVDSEVELATLTFKKSIITVELEKVILNDAFTFYIHNKQIIAAHKIVEESREIKQILEAVRAYTKENEVDKAEDYDTTGSIKKVDESVAQKETVVKNIIDETHPKPVAKERGIVADEIVSENVSVKAEDKTTTEKCEGYLAQSCKKYMVELSKEDCAHPIEILMADGKTRIFDYCDEFAVSNYTKYIVVRQKDISNKYVFFVFQSRNGNNALVSDEQDRKMVYSWFREKHKDEYIFIDTNNHSLTQALNFLFK